MDDWKPIETAPRDRTWFLARTAEGAVRYVHFDDSYDRYPISHNGECWSTPPIEWCAVSVPDLTAELRKVKAEWDAAQSFIENDADWKFSAKRRLQLFREQRKRAETAEAEVAHWENVAIARDAKIKAAEAEVARLRAELAAARGRVKPLEWREVNDGNRRKGEVFGTRSPVSFAPITAHKKHDGWWLSADCKTYPTLEAAKAAAQADYTARILAALDKP